MISTGATISIRRQAPADIYRRRHRTQAFIHGTLRMRSPSDARSATLPHARISGFLMIHERRPLSGGHDYA